MKIKEGNFEKTIDFRTAYDKRNIDPKKNYGIHGVELRFLLKGPKGAVQFLLFTNWHLPHVQKELENTTHWSNPFIPMAADLGYHSYKPRCEGQTSVGKCDYLNGEECFYDGSTVNAEKPFKILVSEGEDALWQFLAEYYKEIFEE